MSVAILNECGMRRISVGVITLISDYLKKYETEYEIFFHITAEKQIAGKILTEGFMFTDCFAKSTIHISSDHDELIYKLNSYRQYGNFVIIICIPKTLYHIRKGCILNIDDVCEYYPDEELNYKLPACFINAYIDIINTNIVTR